MKHVDDYKYGRKAVMYDGEIKIISKTEIMILI